MAEAKLRDLGFMGRILDNTSHDFQGLSRRFSAVAEARARYIVLPTSVQDVSVAVKFATRFVHLPPQIQRIRVSKSFAGRT